MFKIKPICSIRILNGIITYNPESYGIFTENYHQIIKYA